MNNLLTIIILVVIIVLVLEIVVFHRIYETQEERDRQMHRLWVAVLVTIVVAVIASMFLKGDSGKSEEGEEYGVFRDIKEWSVRKQAYAKAKRAGATDSEARLAEAQKATQQQERKLAGKKAEAEVHARQKGEPKP